MYVYITPGSYNMTLYAVNGVQVENNTRGTFIKNIQVDDNSTAYPSNGISGDYWYTSTGSEQIKGSLVDIITSDDPNTYPDNGISGNYWYVKISE